MNLSNENHISKYSFFGIWSVNMWHLVKFAEKPLLWHGFHIHNTAFLEPRTDENREKNSDYEGYFLYLNKMDIDVTHTTRPVVFVWPRKW